MPPSPVAKRGSYADSSLTAAAMAVYFSRQWSAKDRHAGGNVDCAVCTLVLRVMDLAGLQNEQQIDQFVGKVCSLFSKFPEIETTCTALWDVFGPEITTLLLEHFSPDDICRKAGGFCPSTSSCRLLPETGLPMEAPPSIWRSLRKPIIESIVWPWDRVANHLPAVDADGDAFSVIPTLRGSHWRGKDCDDLNANIYPGRARLHTDLAAFEDYSCNGIQGPDPATGQPYKDVLCGTSGQLGTITLGDSASAHFHLPHSFHSSDDFAVWLEDELDWPQCSWSTGTETCWDTASDPKWPVPQVPFQSIYSRLRERNRCNHRDYENVSVNGARSSSIAGHNKNATRRNQQFDHPALVFVALFGNDVCNPHPEPSHMTTPAEFRANAVEILEFLESILPIGSHVVLIGNEHGEMWADHSQRMHPALNVTYADLWTFMDCLQANPCYAWLNANASYRELAIQLAAEQSSQFADIVATMTFRNFDMAYVENPDLINQQAWVAAGGDSFDLYEWVDGGHPSSLQQAMTAEYMWNYLLSKRPNFLGEVNPQNSLIEKLFGDQGGY